MLVYNKTIPFGHYKLLTMWPFIFAKNQITEIDLNHEKIHMSQQKELLLIGFYIVYAVEWIVNMFKYKNEREAYRNISFEKEAYANENNLNYRRKHFAMWRN